MLRLGFGNKTDAEVKLVTHSAFFTWVTREDRIWKMLALANYWEPYGVLAFIQAADPNWGELLKDIGIAAEDIPIPKGDDDERHERDAEIEKFCDTGYHGR